MSDESDRIQEAHDDGEKFEASNTYDPLKIIAEAIDKHVRYDQEELDAYEKGADNVRKQKSGWW
ncbi:MAG: hypothetical protein WCQ00_02275 [bacterium]